MGVLDGKVAIVTGATSGIGAATAALFAREGARVAIAGRRRDEGEALARQLGRNAIFIRTDVGKEGDVKSLIGRTLKRFGRLDCLFNNAGIPGKLTSIADVDMEHFEAIMSVHVRGVVLGMKHATPAMLRQGSGSIINTGSVAGLRGGYSGHMYSTAKAAVIHLTRCVAMELGEKGIRVNSISPGAIATGIFAKGAGFPDGVADRTAEALKAGFAKVQPIPRAGLAEDVAEAALYLASDAASFINGHDIVVDGGMIGGRPMSLTMAQRAGMAQRMAELAKEAAAQLAKKSTARPQARKRR
ncbi:MAG: SDR family oxidoreductase [Proteobacteria bacterium]|nr:SDR family oxidoreductase [Pseudomonadota bacterium]